MFICLFMLISLSGALVSLSLTCIWYLFQVAGPDVPMPNNSLIPAPVQDKAPSVMNSSAEASGKPMGKRHPGF